MASRVTELQKNLIAALLESGITRDLLLNTVDLLLGAKQQGKESITTSEVEQQCTPEPVNHPANRILSDTCSSDGDSTKDFSPNEDLHEHSPSSLINHDSMVEHLLRMDPWQAARVIKLYMQQHNIPQREVVESTGLNQSHLSQHLNKGTPMKGQKRSILYTWFERKQKEVAHQYNHPGKRIYSDEFGSPSKKSRRNRFKWGPASTNLLYHSYEQQRNPSKEERESLVIQCNKAECEQRGVSYHNVEGLGPNLVTESRVYNWFANRRKEETFRMKLAVEAASYQDNPGQSLGSPITSQMSMLSPKTTMATPRPHVPPLAQTTNAARTAASVQSSYPIASSAFQAVPGVQAMPAESRGQVLPGVGSLIHPVVDTNVLPLSRVLPVMPTQASDNTVLSPNHSTTGVSSLLVTPPPPLTVNMTPSASQAIRAIASSMRQFSMHPIPITTSVTSSVSLTNAAIPQGLVMTCSMPSTTICHTAQAQSPVTTAQRTDEKEIVQLEQRFSEQHVLNIQNSGAGNKQTMVSQPCVDNQDFMTQHNLVPRARVSPGQQSSDNPDVSGEHVIHHVVQAISEETLDHTNIVVPEDPAKNMDETKTMEALSDLTLPIKMEVNGGSVEEVDSIGQTVTVETSESYENSAIKGERNNSKKAVVVRVNGNHGDVRGSRTP